VSAGHGTADSRSSSGARFGAGPNPRIAAIEMSQIPRQEWLNQSIPLKKDSQHSLAMVGVQAHHRRSMLELIQRRLGLGVRPSERVPFDGKEESSSGVCQGHNTTRLSTIVSEDVSDMSVSPDVNGGRQGRTKERVQRGTCEGCGQRVFVGERRMRHANGTYFHKGCYKRGVSAGHGTADSRSSSGARFGAGPNPRIAAIEMSQIPSPLAYAMWA